jgi:uncharacterized Zn-binding protein involved in type VI secretion
MSTPGTPPIPHVGGPVAGPGCLSVLIEGKPAARVGDSCTCVGEPDIIITGSLDVFIGGMPAARVGDRTAHGGVVVSGSGTVWIGEVGKCKKPRIIKSKPESEGAKELTPEEKEAEIKQAIAKSVVLLEKKLQLLEQNDYNTSIQFKKWFGKDNEEAKKIISERMERTLEVSKRLTIESFKIINEEDKGKRIYAEIYPDDESFVVFLGNMFWAAPTTGKDSRSGILVHELSHVNEIGRTLDHAHGESDCLLLAKIDPSEALYNADSFEFLIEM